MAAQCGICAGRWQASVSSTWTPIYGWADPSHIGRLPSPCPDCVEVVQVLNQAGRAHYEAEVALGDAGLAFGRAMQAHAAGEHRERAQAAGGAV
jgi:hypothetical protein